MSDIEWACRWVGWKWRGERVVPLYDNDGGAPRSPADLAEAVRVKWMEADTSADWVSRQDKRDATAEAAITWMDKGPEAFIAAVREEHA